ncbi:MAG TPA: sigma-70 family RNA polymerase sigma factor [Arachidicoccus soli]|uniref:Sigma-70 family RNA polymerase sigma factor n=1 Tax=Arachidicoccus soli TaxID=2341117 RepID=A0A386HMH0_9BACT|nr:sigma-70 family RNA polymerase sigma factor [Arachidicoccus soli]AYD46985.1 sigma-70 family RNA polymerase sigma factor [Arachidicoccus soli]HEU0228904.1 sigma-70 family RNA polymerase sigma factor [Arachidicoccus soli]
MNPDKKEHILLQGLANNDSKAIEIIYENNFSTIQALILNNNGSYDDARDVFQEAIMILYEKSKSESFELSSQIKTFLYAVCKKIWLKKLQARGKHATYLDPSLIENTVIQESDLDTARQLDVDFNIMEAALEKIGEPCKSLLKAYYIRKKGMGEIAEMFGYTNPDNAKNQKYKCLMRLKKLFFAQYNKMNEDE